MCKIPKTVGILAASQGPIFEESRIPITNPAIATNIVKAIFDDKLAQLERLWTQDRIRLMAFNTSLGEAVRADERMRQFVRIVTTPS